MPHPSWFEQILGPSGEVVFGMGQDYDDRGSAPTEDDAALISAAPEMYAALRELANAENLTGFTIGAWLEEAARIVNKINREMITDK